MVTVDLISQLAENSEHSDAESSSQLARSSDSGDSAVVEKILESHEMDGHLEFLVRWEDGSDSWEPYTNLNCPQKLDDFYKANPSADQCYLRFAKKRGPMQLLLKVKTNDGVADMETNGHLIYANWFVDCSNAVDMYSESLLYGTLAFTNYYRLSSR